MLERGYEVGMLLFNGYLLLGLSCTCVYLWGWLLWHWLLRVWWGIRYLVGMVYVGGIQLGTAYDWIITLLVNAWGYYVYCWLLSYWLYWLVCLLGVHSMVKGCGVWVVLCSMLGLVNGCYVCMNSTRWMWGAKLQCCKVNVLGKAMVVGHNGMLSVIMIITTYYCRVRVTGWCCSSCPGFLGVLGIPLSTYCILSEVPHDAWLVVLICINSYWFQ